MTATHAAFQRAICRDPGDDAPRLIYADFLDEPEQSRPIVCPSCTGDGHARFEAEEKQYRNTVPGTCYRCDGTGRVSNGNAERAEFIRVQVELARQPDECDRTFCDGSLVVCPDCRRWKALRKRERELENGYSHLWLAPILIRLYGPDAIPVIPGEPRNEGRVFHWTFSRGFISHVTLSMADFLTHAKELFGRHPIERVTLSDKQPTRILHVTEELSYGFEMVDDNAEDSFQIREQIFAHFGCGDRWPNNRRRWWDSESAAVAALSDAAVAFGRASVGLPPIAVGES